MNNKISAVFAALSAFAAAGFIPALDAPAAAMGITPLQLEMTSIGQTSRSQLSVTNDSDNPLPVEASIEKLTLEEDGTRKTVKAGSEFLVFPPQAVIPPRTTQVFRVQWVGEPMLAKSESFVLTMKQLPLRLPGSKGAVQVVMAFGVIVDVAPQKGVPSLKIVGTGVATGKDGKRHPTITVENASNTHALLPQSTIALSSGQWSKSLDAGAMQQVGIGLVQPGKRRKFVLPVDLPAGVNSVQASLDFKPRKP